MRNKDAARLSSEITAIRGLQCMAAEAKAAEAASALRTKAARAEACQTGLLSIEAAWRDAMAAPSVCVEMLSLWSAELLRQEALLGQCVRDVELATKQLQDKARDWHASLSRRDLAARQSRKNSRNALERRDDVALQNALDRHAIGGSAL